MSVWVKCFSSCFLMVASWSAVQAAPPGAAQAKENPSAPVEGGLPLQPQTRAVPFGPVRLKVQDQVVFSPEGTWVYLPLGDLNPVRFSEALGRRQEVRLAGVGTSMGFRSFRKNAFWDIRKLATDEANPKGRTCLFRLPETSTGEDWELAGLIETESGIPNYLVPLDREDWFLAVGPYFGFHKDGHASPLALFRLEKGRLQLQELVDLPFGDQVNLGALQTETRTLPSLSSEANAEPRTLVIARCVIQPASLRPTLWVPALLPGHLVLGASQAGVLWFFSLKDGHCQQTVDLGGVDRKDLEHLDLLDHFLLAAEPGKDNDLIVVTRDPDVLLQAAALAPPAGAPADVRAAIAKRFAEIVNEKTALKWWSIDPLTGKKQRLDRPGDFPERTSFLQQSEMRFLVGADGRVHANTTGTWGGVLEQMNLKKPPVPAPAEKAGAKARPEGGKATPTSGPTPRAEDLGKPVVSDKANVRPGTSK